MDNWLTLNNNWMTEVIRSRHVIGWATVSLVYDTILYVVPILFIHSEPSSHGCFNVGWASQTVIQHWNNRGWIYRVCWGNGLIAAFPRKTREPILSYCWASVVDDGPSLNQHWFYFLCSGLLWSLLLENFTWYLKKYLYQLLKYIST